MTTVWAESDHIGAGFSVLDGSHAVVLDYELPARVRILAEGVAPAVVAAILERLQLGRLRDYDEAEVFLHRLNLGLGGSSPGRTESHNEITRVPVVY